MERDGGFDDVGAENDESFVVFFGEGSVCHARRRRSKLLKVYLTKEDQSNKIITLF